MPLLNEICQQKQQTHDSNEKNYELHRKKIEYSIKLKKLLHIITLHYLLPNVDMFVLTINISLKNKKSDRTIKTPTLQI